MAYRAYFKTRLELIYLFYAKKTQGCALIFMQLLHKADAAGNLCKIAIMFYYIIIANGAASGTLADPRPAVREATPWLAG